MTVSGGVYGGSIQSVTCVSSDPHSGSNITDDVDHYFGCVEYCERERYWSQLSDESQCAIRRQLRRVAYVRESLKDSDDEEERLSIRTFAESLATWRLRNQEGILATATWRLEQGRATTIAHDPSAGVDVTREPYDPLKDVEAFVVEYKPHHEGEYGRSGSQHSYRRVSVHDLLYGETNLLRRRVGESSAVRYFHFPANNMQWVQDAIARYYGETDVEFDTEHREVRQRSLANSLLRRSFWRGQEQGQGLGSGHSRHMRPLCEAVTSDFDDHSPLNITLFMPFLHWEMDRQRASTARYIEKYRERRQKQMSHDFQAAYQSRKDERMGLPQGELAPGAAAGLSQRRSRSAQPNGLRHRRSRDVRGPYKMAGAYPEAAGSPVLLNSRKSGRQRLTIRCSLGQLLYDAFKLFESIDNHRDRKLLERYIHAEPPMHPRRTIAQAYYWTLSSTRARDQDQVTFRSTSAPQPPLYSETLVSESAETFAPDMAGLAEVADLEQGWLPGDPNCPLFSAGPALPGHTRYRSECAANQEAIQKRPRLLMVDQLWLGVLDDETVISFFPQLHGSARRGDSNVHASIRKRLSNFPKTYVQNAHDLALIIMEECSNVFFDRAKMIPLQPEILNNFSQTIDRLANLSNIAFEQLALWANEGSPQTKQNGPSEQPQLLEALFDLTMEGRLQRETRNALEELGMMMQILETQYGLLTAFRRGATSAMEYNETLKPAKDPRFEDRRRARLRERVDIFRGNANTALEIHEGYMKEIQALQRRANEVNQRMGYLLGLKQQQASVHQAWQAILQQREASKQSRALIVFTVITIVFLPLSFMSSVFGMNNFEFTGDSMGLSSQLGLMFGVSTGVIAIVLVAAFSRNVQGLFWSFVRVSFDWAMVRTGIYRLWLRVSGQPGAGSRASAVQDSIQEKKAEMRRQIRVRSQIARRAKVHDSMPKMPY